MRRKIIGYECSQYTPGAYWVYGSEYYGCDFEIEYPDELDHLEDDELVSLSADDDRIKFIDEVTG